MNDNIIYPILGILLLVGIGLGIGSYKKGSTRPSDRYHLSPSQLETLTSKAEHKKDGDAAFQVALHYMKIRNEDLALKWMRKASSLGNASAKTILKNGATSKGSP